MSGPLMIPRDNYSCDIVRGVPGNMSHFIMCSSFFSRVSGGLSEVLAPLVRLGVCGFSAQPQSIGQWNIYMER